MPMMWLAPAAVAFVAVALIVPAIRRVANDAMHLRRELVRFSELRPALLELRNDATAVRRASIETYHRLPRRR